jgi:hypothetical protein
MSVKNTNYPNIKYDNEYIYVQIPNPNEGNKDDLMYFYSLTYFDLVDLDPEIYINNVSGERQTGGYFQDINKLYIPYKYFVYLMEYNPISLMVKNVSLVRQNVMTNMVLRNTTNQSSLQNTGQNGFNFKIKIPEFNEFSKYFTNKTLNLNQNARDVPNVENERDVPNVENERDVSNVENERDVPNAENARDVPNVENERDVPNAENARDVPNVENERDVPNSENTRDVPNAENTRDVLNAEDKQKSSKPVEQTSTDTAKPTEQNAFEPLNDNETSEINKHTNILLKFSAVNNKLKIKSMTDVMKERNYEIDIDITPQLLKYTEIENLFEIKKLQDLNNIYLDEIYFINDKIIVLKGINSVELEQQHELRHTINLQNELQYFQNTYYYKQYTETK